ncbi:hypothetical protein BC628DRAFT_75747 [Trametes gibbosa]|nr:hypothetical protein BC628DRAFT_75747 [Trametes gibbosa]
MSEPYNDRSDSCTCKSVTSDRFKCISKFGPLRSRKTLESLISDKPGSNSTGFSERGRQTLLNREVCTTHKRLKGKYFADKVGIDLHRHIGNFLNSKKTQELLGIDTSVRKNFGWHSPSVGETFRAN